MSDLLSVGEIGRLFGLNVQTLHYYERVGLFAPAERTESGHRRYEQDQIYQLASVRYWRRMGYSIDEIHSFLDARTPEITLNRLREHSEILRQQVAKLQHIDAAICRKIEYIEQKTRDLDTNSITQKYFPRRWYIPVGTESQIYGRDEFYLYPTIAFYEKSGKHFGVYVDDEGAAQLRNEPSKDGATVVPELLSIPEGWYLVGYHKGAYERIPESFERMRKHYSQLRFGEPVVNFNIIDQFVERNADHYITEIQMPIAD